MNDIELNKVIEAARYCAKHATCSCYDDECPMHIGGLVHCVFPGRNDTAEIISTLADRLDALTAENAEKDKRIAELEAGQKHGKWVDAGRCCCKCTACGNHVLGNTSESLRRYNFRPYCENCGAKMDGE